MKAKLIIGASLCIFVLTLVGVMFLLGSCGTPPNAPAPNSDVLQNDPNGRPREPVRLPRVTPLKPSRPTDLDPKAVPTPVQNGAMAISSEIKTYVTRGIITELPDGTSKRYLTVHHETIEFFEDRTGSVVGMKEMIMPFPDLAVDLEGFEVGQAVELTFEVRWNQPPRTLVTSIVKLNKDTTLKLSPEAK